MKTTFFFRFKMRASSHTLEVFRFSFSYKHEKKQLITNHFPSCLMIESLQTLGLLLSRDLSSCKARAMNHILSAIEYKASATVIPSTFPKIFTRLSVFQNKSFKSTRWHPTPKSGIHAKLPRDVFPNNIKMLDLLLIHNS